MLDMFSHPVLRQGLILIPLKNQQRQKKNRSLFRKLTEIKSFKVLGLWWVHTWRRLYIEKMAKKGPSGLGLLFSARVVCVCVCMPGNTLAVLRVWLQPDGLMFDLISSHLISDSDSVFLLRERWATTFSLFVSQWLCINEHVVLRSILSSNPAHVPSQRYRDLCLSPLWPSRSHRVGCQEDKVTEAPFLHYHLPPFLFPSHSLTHLFSSDHQPWCHLNLCLCWGIDPQSHISVCLSLSQLVWNWIADTLVLSGRDVI